MDAFTIDPTTTQFHKYYIDKAKYLHTIRMPVWVAGNRVLVRPKRAWAVAPIPDQATLLGDMDGTAGVIGLCPQAKSRRGFLAWVADVDSHARAWRRS
jgi:hypothetical protein